MSRAVLNFVFAFDDVRILTTFQLFYIWRTARSISVECKYFILSNTIEFYWTLDRWYWLKRTMKLAIPPLRVWHLEQKTCLQW